MELRTWRNWNVFDWSEQLLDHYFLRTDEDAGPVSNIVVSPVEFAAMVGEGPETGEEVIAAFTSRTLQSLGAVGIWTKAEMNSRMQNGRPMFLAYLVFACLVAVDADDPDERSFLRRLDDAVGADAERGIEKMASLWEGVAAWLLEDENRQRYRPLLLPDPGGWTRIGHTVKLAFPTRQDQLALARILTSAGLAQRDPPPGPVFGALDGGRERFSNRFRVEWSAARQAWAERADLEELGRSPFWAAVRSAAEIVSTEGGVSRGRWTLIAEDDELDLDLRLVTNEANGDDLVDSGARLWPSEAPPEQLTALLDGGASPSPELGAIVRGGVLAFAGNSDGDYELVGKADLDIAATAVVRDDIVEAFTNRYGGRVGEYAHVEWSVVRGCSVRVEDSSSFVDSPLAGTYLLHRAPSRFRLILRGGVRIGSGFLGHPSAIPVIAGDAVAGLISGPEQSVDLVRALDGSLRIPDDYTGDGLVGKHTLLVEGRNRADAVREIEFVTSPATEAFKQTTDMSSWVAAGAIGACRIVADAQLHDRPPEIPADGSTTMLLGRDVGEFVENETDAAWSVTNFGGRVLLRQLTDDVTPRHEIDHAGSCRRWRRLLRKAARVDPIESGQQLVSAQAFGLPKVPYIESLVADLPDHLKTSAVHPAVSTTIDVLVARANRRAGLRFRSTVELLREQFDLSDSQVWTVIDMWDDAGLFSASATTRWTNRMIWPHQPHLAIFEVGGLFGARLTGFTMQSTTEHAIDIAESLGLAVSLQGSESGLLPPVLLVRSDRKAAIEELGSRCRIPILPADLRLDLPAAGDARAEDVRGHDRRRTVQLQNCDGTIVRWAHGKGPTRWEARAQAGSMWFYSRRSAIFAATALASAPSVERVGATLVSAEARLPHPLASESNLVSPLAAGPSGDFSMYRYWYPTAKMASRIQASADELAATIRQSARQGWQ